MPAPTYRRTRSDRSSAARRRPRRSKTILWAVVVLALVGAVAFVPAARITDRSTFCKTCHTMVPFYNAWEQGPHKDVECIECHVDSGTARRLMHKFVALNEVYAEFFTHSTFPNYNADIPDARCERCHPEVMRQTTTADGKFSHVTHLNKGVRCAQCHASTGHKVTFSALKDAGLLNPANAPAGLTYVGESFKASTGKPSALPGHKSGSLLALSRSGEPAVQLLSCRSRKPLRGGLQGLPSARQGLREVHTPPER